MNYQLLHLFLRSTIAIMLTLLILGTRYLIQSNNTIRLKWFRLFIKNLLVPGSPR